jgi:tRNA (guanine26-N2/guanine27-N2)-dimethyltransferase
MNANQQIISEASSKIYGELQEVVDKDMDVFYNPVMRINRDTTILILSAEDQKEMKIADPLAGSGIRTFRILKEIEENNPEKIKSIFVNDKKWEFKNYFEKNIELNNLSESQKSKLKIHEEDANIFLLKNKVFDYIDIDPFGSPNPFLDSAVQSLRNKSILAITATDTSALCGSYPTAGERKYWAIPLRNELMHEFGTRILIRKVQLIGGQHDKALTPIFTFAKEHYMKVFFRCENGKKKVDEIMKQHNTFHLKDKIYGPVWLGQLWDKILVENMLKLSETADVHKETKKLITAINEECKIEVPFFFDIHQLSRKKKTGDNPRFEKLIEQLRNKGFQASRTHFSMTGIKTDAPEEEVSIIFDEEMNKIKK